MPGNDESLNDSRPLVLGAARAPRPVLAGMRVRLARVGFGCRRNLRAQRVGAQHVTGHWAHFRAFAYGRVLFRRVGSPGTRRLIRIPRSCRRISACRLSRACHRRRLFARATFLAHDTERNDSHLVGIGRTLPKVRGRPPDEYGRRLAMSVPRVWSPRTLYLSPIPTLEQSASAVGPFGVRSPDARVAAERLSFAFRASVPCPRAARRRKISCA